AWPTKSASTGSSRPLTSMTSTVPDPAACASARGIAATTAASTRQAMDSLRIGLSGGERLDPARFCAQTRLLIVAGKGGVGKTTVTAALARMAARAGLSTLIVEVEGKSGLAAAFGAPELTYEERVLWPADGDAA